MSWRVKVLLAVRIVRLSNTGFLFFTAAVAKLYRDVEIR